jgi:lysophospholipase L1-like esterase
MSIGRWFDGAAIALSAAVLVTLGVILHPRETATVAVAPPAANVDRPQLSAADRPSVVFIGDSYTGGNGTAEVAYTCMAAARMGWLCNLSAVPATGYITGGAPKRFFVDPHSGMSTSFVERIAALSAKYQPDIVVLDGGRNDHYLPHGDVYLAMLGTIEEVRRAWPTAKVVFIRPRFLDTPSDDLGFDDSFIDRLRAEPAAKGMVILDPMRGFAGTDTSALLGRDGIHPNQQGEMDLTSALVASLTDHGFAVTP